MLFKNARLSQIQLKSYLVWIPYLWCSLKCTSSEMSLQNAMTRTATTVIGPLGWKTFSDFSSSALQLCWYWGSWPIVSQVNTPPSSDVAVPPGWSAAALLGLCVSWLERMNRLDVDAVAKPRLAETKLSKLGVYGWAAFTAATLPVHSAQPRHTAVSLKVGVFKGESQLTIRPPSPATQTH